MIAVPIRFPVDLKKELEAAASKFGLSFSDISRLSMERGVKTLVAQLGAQVATRGIPLPERVIEDIKLRKILEKKG